ncbi:MAG: response regulator [Gemmatimonadota bacterium]
MARVLVVDDDPASLDTTRRMLEKGEHEVKTAPDGQAAIEVLKDEIFDVVLCDIRMPGVDGVEFLKRLRELGDATPVITMTGGGWQSRDGILGLTESLGATATVAKPFDMKTLLATVRRVVDEHGGGKAGREA